MKHITASIYTALRSAYRGQGGENHPPASCVSAKSAREGEWGEGECVRDRGGGVWVWRAEQSGRRVWAAGVPSNVEELDAVLENSSNLGLEVRLGSRA